MCGRFTLIAWDEIEKRFLPTGSGMEIIRERFAETDPERYNIAPTQDVVTIANDGEANVAQFMRWGLVPSWAKDISIGSRMINARAETLAESVRASGLRSGDAGASWSRTASTSGSAKDAAELRRG